MNEPQIFSVIVLTFERKIEFEICIWSDGYESQISMNLSVIGYDFVFGVLLI